VFNKSFVSRQYGGCTFFRFAQISLYVTIAIPTMYVIFSLFATDQAELPMKLDSAQWQHTPSSSVLNNLINFRIPDALLSYFSMLIESPLVHHQALNKATVHEHMHFTVLLFSLTIIMIMIIIIIIHWTHYLFSDWPKAYSEFWNSAPVIS